MSTAPLPRRHVLQELHADLAVLSEAIEALCASAVHPLPVFMRSDSSASDLLA